MKNLLKDKEKHYKNYANDVYKKYKQRKYGINCRVNDSMLSEIRKEIVDFQAIDDQDQFTKVSISYQGWLPVVYDNSDKTIEFRSPYMSPSRHELISGERANITLGYNTGVAGVANIVEVNSSGCITRINLNPTININNQANAQFTFRQAVPSTTWTINHTLGFIPNIFTINENGIEVIGVVHTATDNLVIVQFSDPVSGYAYLS